MFNINNTTVKYFIGCMSLLFFTVYMSFYGLNYSDGEFNNKSIESMSIQMQQIQVIEKEQLRFVEKVKKIARSRHTDLTNSQLDSVAYLIYSLQFKYDNLDPNLVCAHITQESNWRKKALSSARAKGLMQIVNSTGAYLAVEEGYTNLEDMDVLLYNPMVNIKLGCRYISEMNKNHGLDGGIIAYNSGAKYAYVYKREKHTNNLPEETKKYLPKVLGYLEEYKMM